MNLVNDKITRDQAILFYKSLITPRLIEEKMLILLRQGKISKWFSGWGQEAVSVGVTLAMDANDYLLPMHRNLGLFTTRGVPLNKLFSQFQGKMNGFTKGRDRSFHFGTQDYKIVGMISHLGPQLGVADGIALANKLKSNQQVAAVFTGDGGASEGDFHESLNVAAVWDLPVIFVIENNQWGLSTPSSEQFKCKQFIDKGIGYGMETMQLNGNNLQEVIAGMRQARNQVLETGKPLLVEMITFRMRGHEEASGTKYYPEGLQDKWEPKDPVAQFETEMLESGVISQGEMDAWKAEIKAEIAKAWGEADAEARPVFDEQQELNDVYAPFDVQPTTPSGNKTEKRFIDAVHDALDQAMTKHDNLVLMGQDIADYGGVFKATEGFTDKYGKDRVRNTPLCESAILGAGLGLSINGYKAMVEMQFADFVSEGITQICNNLAKIHWRWGQNADVVVRMPTGAGVAAGPYHSQSTEAWFAHTPGLKVAYPAFPADAKGLLLRAFEDPNPVLFFEHKALYRSVSEEVSEGYYSLPFGKANVLTTGSELTIVTYGLGVHWALEEAKNHPEGAVEVIDLRTLVPLDEETIYDSVNKTGKVLVLHEDVARGGFGGELVALINEHCFEQLDAPVKRLGSLNTAVPFAPELEQGFLAKSKLSETVKSLLDY